MKGVWQDVRYGLRALGRQRGYTVLALLVLGTAIGLNTSLFTTFNAVMLRPWPVPEPGRVVRVFGVSAKGSREIYDWFSVAEQRYLNESTRSFSGLFATRDEGLCGPGLRCSTVSGNFFDALRVPFEVGRGFRPEDDRIDTPTCVAVLSYRAWQRHYGGAPDVIGRTIVLREVPFTVVGVAGRGFTGTSWKRHDDVWLPLSVVTLLHPKEEWPRRFLTVPGHASAGLGGRLAPGASMAQAQAEIAQQRRAYRASMGLDESDTVLSGTSLAHDLRDRPKVLPVAGLLFLAVTLVLLLACANVGNIVLARGLARRHEIAVRLSLGAGRARLVRQLLTESLVLAGVAGALGSVLAFVLPPYLPIVMGLTDMATSLRPDLYVLAYAIGLVLLTCLAFGLAPALHCTRTDVSVALRDRSETTGTRVSLRGALLAVQVAVSVVLLAGAGLLVRGVRHATSVLELGFSAHDVAVASIRVDDKAYDEARKREIVARLEQELAGLPGRPDFGLTNVIPLGYQSSLMDVRLPAQDKSQTAHASIAEVSSGYFDVLRIPLLLGRTFTANDAGRPVILVNQTLAHRYWPEKNPVGQVLVVGPERREVVGVVGDARTESMYGVLPAVYILPVRPFIPNVLIRDDGGTSATMAALVARIDPQARVSVERLDTNIGRKLRPARVGAITAGVIGVLGLVLATIGLAGVFAYSVQQRTREIGIRMALGARAADVVRLVLGSSSRAVLTGTIVGVLAAMAASRLLSSHLYGLSPLDPFVYAAVAALLSLAIAAASYIPARRAARVDPTVALRYE